MAQLTFTFSEGKEHVRVVAPGPAAKPCPPVQTGDVVIKLGQAFTVVEGPEAEAYRKDPNKFR